MHALTPTRLMVRSTFVAVLSASLSALSAGAAVSAPTTIATLSEPVAITAYGGYAAWSERDAATRQYRLTLREPDGRISTPDVPSRPVPFDVDLGPNAAGEVVAVYSRCGTESRIRHGYYRRDQRDCDVFILDVERGSERRVGGVSTSRGSEFTPSVWRNRIVFARVRPGRGRAAIYVRRLDSQAASKRLRGGTRGNRPSSGPSALDSYGRRVAYVWHWQQREHFDTRDGKGMDVDYQANEVRLNEPEGRSRRLEAGVLDLGSGPDLLGSPSFGNGRLWFIRKNWDDNPATGRALFSYRWDTDTLQRKRWRVPAVASARDADVLWVLRGDPDAVDEPCPCALVRDDAASTAGGYTYKPPR